MSDYPVKLRREFEEFLGSKERVFEFEVKCGPEERIKYIYDIVFPRLRLARFYLNFFIAKVARLIDYSPIKVFLYRLTGMKIGTGVFISPDVILDPHYPSLITLEDYCILGWGARLFTHEYSDNKYRVGRIRIGRGAVVGGYSTIRGGVTVGEMTDVPYGSIIYKDISEHTTARSLVRERLRENG